MGQQQAAALVEALLFDAFGLDIGPIGSDRLKGLNRSYRSIEVVSAPPLDEDLVEVGLHLLITMFEELKTNG